MNPRVLLAGVFGLLLLRCSNQAAEGEHCERANGNADCTSGLICRSGLDVQAGKDVCCAPAWETPGVQGCFPATQDLVPDPSVSPGYGSGGSVNPAGGAAGAAGSGGAAAGAGGAAGTGGAN